MCAQQWVQPGELRDDSRRGSVPSVGVRLQGGGCEGRRWAAQPGGGDAEGRPRSEQRCGPLGRLQPHCVPSAWRGQQQRSHGARGAHRAGLIASRAAGCCGVGGGIGVSWSCTRCCAAVGRTSGSPRLGARGNDPALLRKGRGCGGAVPGPCVMCVRVMVQRC